MPPPNAPNAELLQPDERAELATVGLGDAWYVLEGGDGSRFYLDVFGERILEIHAPPT